MDDQGTEMVSFQLVAAAGEARSLAFEALEKAKAGDFDAAAKLMSSQRMRESRLTTSKRSCFRPRRRASICRWMCCWSMLRTTSCAPCLLRSSCRS